MVAVTAQLYVAPLVGFLVLASLAGCSSNIRDLKTTEESEDEEIVIVEDITVEKTAGGKGRNIRYQEPLEYPDWAKEGETEAKVVLRFKVLPSGSVDSQIGMVKSSGWPKLDELAIKSMRNYLFEPLPLGVPQIPQWGEITFSFVPD